MEFSKDEEKSGLPGELKSFLSNKITDAYFAEKYEKELEMLDFDKSAGKDLNASDKIKKSEGEEKKPGEDEEPVNDAVGELTKMLALIKKIIGDLKAPSDEDSELSAEEQENCDKELAQLEATERELSSKLSKVKLAESKRKSEELVAEIEKHTGKTFETINDTTKAESTISEREGVVGDKGIFDEPKGSFKIGYSGIDSK